MGVRTASGASTRLETASASAEAVTTARARLGDRTPHVGLLFVSPRHDLRAALAAARAAAPGVTFAGCTTAGEFTEAGLLHGGLVAFLISTKWPWAAAVVRDAEAHALEAATTLSAPFEPMRAQGRKGGLEASATVLLVDGLSNPEPMVDALQGRTRAGNRVVGGGAGDEGALERTVVGLGDVVGSGVAAALHFATPRSWGVGVAHGLSPDSAKLLVTKTRGNVVLELDGRPAQDVYRERARLKGVTLTAETWPAFLLQNELGIYLSENFFGVRAPISLAPEGGVRFAAPVLQGAQACMMTGTVADMVKAATRAAQDARAGLGGPGDVAGVLVFSCICRGLLLREAYGQELEAIGAVFPGVSLAGFLTYGELARYQGSLDGYHNNTVVVVAIPSA